MSLSKAGLATRREHLEKQIARQRAELAEAYRDLGRPLKYTQTGIKGFQFLKQNGWLLALSPSVVGLVFSFLGWKKTDQPRPKWFPFPWKKKPVEDEAEKEESGISRRARPLLHRLIRHGVSAFKIYRKVRPFIPL
jgi:hypothetical protein